MIPHLQIYFVYIFIIVTNPLHNYKELKITWLRPMGLQVTSYNKKILAAS